MGTRGIAEDLVQTALWRVVKQWGRASESPVAYSRQVLVHLAMDGWRKRGRLPKEVVTEFPPDRSSTTFMDSVADRSMLITALRTLPSRQRTALVLRYWEDLSVEQTAQLMGCSTGTIKSTCSKALQRLRGVLQEEGSQR